jgi:hypothetical protein
VAMAVSGLIVIAVSAPWFAFARRLVRISLAGYRAPSCCSLGRRDRGADAGDVASRQPSATSPDTGAAECVLPS